jgi:hypothetical protein
MTDEANLRVTVMMHEDLLTWVKAEAKRRRTSVSFIVRDLIGSAMSRTQYENREIKNVERH